MIDITHPMLEFKEGIRHIWNSYFANSDAPMSPDTQMAFSAIERALLSVLVLSPHGVGDVANSYRLHALSTILVKPVYAPWQMPIRLGAREPNGNVIWDKETIVEVEEATQFHFFDFFDWCPDGRVDMPFVRVRGLPPSINLSNEKSFGLIEQRYCRFMLDVA
jgi:hypothetical protein